jgi:hypothetical protein
MKYLVTINGIPANEHSNMSDDDIMRIVDSMACLDRIGHHADVFGCPSRIIKVERIKI